jgi:hypothetical protein
VTSSLSAKLRGRARRVLRGLLTLGAVTLVAPVLRAQDAAPGRLEGVVTADGTSRPQSVTVAVARLEPEPLIVRVTRTDSLGRYRIDSLPAGRYLLDVTSALLDSLQLAIGAREVRVVAGESVRVDLSLPSEATLRAAAIESAARSAARATVDTATGELELIGTASVAGRVTGTAGEPLAGVQLHVRDARGVVTRDSSGRYVLTGLPAGTHVLVARRLGYALAEQVVELRAGVRTTADLRPERSVALDSMRVTARGGRFREFEFNRGANIFGRYLTRDQILRRRPADGADLLFRLGGFTVVGHGDAARVFTKRQMRNRVPCETNVVVDRVQRRRINDVPPARIVGLEAYEGPSSFTSDFESRCGLIVIWTSDWRR